MPVDVSLCQNALTFWRDLVKVGRGRANETAAWIVRDRTREILSQYSHDPQTRTPSPPGSPPGSITGQLAASIKSSLVYDGDYPYALVGPIAKRTGWADEEAARSSNGYYARFLELGPPPDHVAHNPSGYMRWTEDGRHYRARGPLKKGPRPYLRPAVESVKADGSLHRHYYDWWLRDQDTVLRFARRASA